MTLPYVTFENLGGKVALSSIDTRAEPIRNGDSGYCGEDCSRWVE